MAFGVHPDRTLLVQVGSVRPFSDVAGRHVVRIDGTDSPLRDIARRLQAAGCDVDTSGDDWASAGRFSRALELVATPTSGTASQSVSAASAAEREAIHDILDELESMRLRVERARRDKHYPFDFALPAAEYHEHKADLSGELREAVGRVYVTADDLTRVVHYRENNGSEVLPEDGLDELSGLISFAQTALRERRAEQ